MKLIDFKKIHLVWVILFSLVLTGCGTTRPELGMAKGSSPADYYYLIGPSDSIEINVWRNADVSRTVTVRPDGMISTPLLEDLRASGKTPTELARDIEKILTKFIKDPVVTVIASGFVGPYSEQVRVVGEATEPQTMAYREKMSVLDVMIEVDGLTDFASGNDASIVRIVNGKQQQFGVRLDDLLKSGDITANVDMRPGDILIIPESWF